jgi:uroporphyrinogen decarboxylase
VLGQATPVEIVEHVRSLVRVFQPGGGFVLNQVHNILGNVPPENVIAMLDTAYDESFYEDGQGVLSQ